MYLFSILSLQGAWKPCLNISTVLTSIQLLMAEPNPEDPLMTEIVNLILIKFRSYSDPMIRSLRSYEAIYGQIKGSGFNQIA